MGRNKEHSAKFRKEKESKREGERVRRDGKEAKKQREAVRRKMFQDSFHILDF